MSRRWLSRNCLKIMDGNTEIYMKQVTFYSSHIHFVFCTRDSQLADGDDDIDDVDSNEVFQSSNWVRPKYGNTM